MTAVVITERAPADALRGGAEYLAPFVARESTVSVAAEELGLPLHRMYYWVRRFHAAGLLEVTREVPRGGRPIKYYRAVADSFEVPPELLPEGVIVGELRSQTEALARALAAEFSLDMHDVVLQVQFPEVDGKREHVSNFTPRRLITGPRTGASTTWSGRGWWLSDEDGQALIDAVRATVEGFEARRLPPKAAGARRYRIVFAVAPEPD